MCAQDSGSKREGDPRKKCQRKHVGVKQMRYAALRKNSDSVRSCLVLFSFSAATKTIGLDLAHARSVHRRVALCHSRTLSLKDTNPPASLPVSLSHRSLSLSFVLFLSPSLSLCLCLSLCLSLSPPHSLCLSMCPFLVLARSLGSLLALALAFVCARDLA